jgi:hypothetical protein
MASARLLDMATSTTRSPSCSQAYFALQYTRTSWFRELTNQSVIGLQLALLKERFEKPGEVEKLIEEIELEQSKDFRDVDSLKEYMARVLAGEVPMVQKNKAWNAKVMLQHGSDTGQQLYDTK